MKMKVLACFLIFLMVFVQNLTAGEEKPDTENKKEETKGTDEIDLDEDDSKAEERKKEREKEKKKEKIDKKKKGKKGKCKV